jgi:hypothetical protein
VSASWKKSKENSWIQKRLRKWEGNQALRQRENITRGFPRRGREERSREKGADGRTVKKGQINDTIRKFIFPWLLQGSGEWPLYRTPMV